MTEQEINDWAFRSAVCDLVETDVIEVTDKEQVLQEIKETKSLDVLTEDNILGHSMELDFLQESFEGSRDIYFEEKVYSYRCQYNRLI